MKNEQAKKEIVRLIKDKIFSKLSWWEIGIFKVLAQDNPDIDGLLSSLHSQREDNELVMNDIIGFEASELLGKYFKPKTIRNEQRRKTVNSPARRGKKASLRKLHSSR